MWTSLRFCHFGKEFNTNTAKKQNDFRHVHIESFADNRIDMTRKIQALLRVVKNISGKGQF